PPSLPSWRSCARRRGRRPRYPRPRRVRVLPASPASSIAAAPPASSCRENQPSDIPHVLLFVAVGTLGGVFNASIGLRRLGGKLAHLDNPGAGKARQHLFHARIGLGGAFGAVSLPFGF